MALGRAGEERGREEKPHPLPVAAETWDDEMDPQPSTEWEDHRKVINTSTPHRHTTSVLCDNETVMCVLVD